MMGKLKNNQSGFSAVEALLILVIVAIVGGTGFYVYHAQQNTNKNLANDNSTAPSFKKKTKSTPKTADPYAGWKTGTLQYEKASYKYPANWTLTGSSLATGHESESNEGLPTGLHFYPGSDDFKLESPSGNHVDLSAGFGSFIPFQITGTSLTISTLGATRYLNIGEFNSGEVPASEPPHEACLSNVNNTNGSEGGKGTIASKNITFDDKTDSPPSSGTGSNLFCYAPKQPQAVAAFESDPDFATAKLIFESMTY